MEYLCTHALLQLVSKPIQKMLGCNDVHHSQRSCCTEFGSGAGHGCCFLGYSFVVGPHDASSINAIRQKSYYTNIPTTHFLPLFLQIRAVYGRSNSNPFCRLWRYSSFSSSVPRPSLSAHSTLSQACHPTRSVEVYPRRTKPAGGLLLRWVSYIALDDFSV